MSKFLLLALLSLAFASPVLSDPDYHPACEARADAVAAQLEREAAAPMSPSERALARRAALASCLDDAPTGQQVARADEEEPAEPDQSRLQRFLAGLFSTDSEPAKKRSGKYRYIEKE